ncbi:MG2 domain-containing protein [Aliikangiella maris]|uniref:MG2 domain-containing protein n=2 Tax=Aliikangiella maris TaxID=3162458 RepID=A0ABV3MLU7_9GAMM
MLNSNMLRYFLTFILLSLLLSVLISCSVQHKNASELQLESPLESQSEFSVSKPDVDIMQAKKNSKSFDTDSAKVAVTNVYQDININYARLELSFSQPMNRLSPEKIQYSVKPDATCLWSWSDKQHLICELNQQAGYQAATSYQLTLQNALQSQTGIALTPFEFQFESPRPQIRSISTDWLSPTSPEITAYFNLPIRAKTLENKLFLIKGQQRISLMVFPNRSTKTNKGRESSLQERDDIWILKPRKKLEADSSYQLLQTAGIYASVGNLASKEQISTERYSEIKTYGDFKLVQRHCWVNGNQHQICWPNQQIFYEFSVPFSTEPLEQCHREFAQANIHLVTNNQISRQLKLIGTVPQMKQPVPCLDKLVDIFGRPLRGESKILLETRDFQPEHQFNYYQDIIPINEPLIADYWSMNVAKAKLTYQAFSTNEKLQSERVSQEILLKADKNQRLKTNIFSYAGDEYVNLTGYIEAEDLPEQSFNIQKSRYNVITQITPESLLIFISDIYTNQPIKNLKLTVDFQGSYQVKTDDSGVAIVPLSQVENFQKRYSRYDNTIDLTFDNGENLRLNYDFNVHLEKNEPINIDYRHTNIHDDNAQKTDGQSVIWGITDKPIYRPGEQVQFAGLLRKIDGVNTQLVKHHLPTEMVVLNEYEYCNKNDCDNIYQNKKVNFDEFGRFSGQFTIPQEAKNGVYYIKLLDKNTGQTHSYNSFLKFTIGQFKAQTIEVKNMPQVPEILTDESFSVKSQVNYYAGGAYINAPVLLSYALESKAFNELVKQFQDYIFTPNITSEKVVPEFRDYQIQAGATDKKGEVITQLSLPAEPVNFAQLAIRAGVKTDSGEMHYSRDSQVVFSRKPYYVGIKQMDWWLNANQPINLQAKVVNLSGEEKNNIRIHYFWQKTVGLWEHNRFDSDAEEEPVVPIQCSNHNLQAKQLTNDFNRCLFTPQKTGYYHFIAQIIYPDGSTQRSASTHYLYQDDQPGDEQIKLQASVDTLAIGETLKFKLQHGYQSASALILIHRQRLLDYQWVSLKPGVNDLSIKIKESYAPGFDMSIFVNYGDLTEIHFDNSSKLVKAVQQRFDVTPPKIKPIVELTLSQSKLKPGETLDVKLKNQSKKSAAVILAVIDESLLNQMPNNRYYQLNDQVMDPAALDWQQPAHQSLVKQLNYAKHQEKELMRQTYDGGLYDSEQKVVITGSRLARPEAPLVMEVKLKDRVAKNRGPIGAGKQSASLTIRELLRESAYWNSSIIVTAKRTQSLRIKMPDNLTRWKVIAISSDLTGQLYVDDDSIQSQLDLQVYAQAPQQVTVGDQVTLTAEMVSLKKLPQVSMSSQVATDRKTLANAATALTESELIANQSSVFKNIQQGERYSVKAEFNVPDSDALFWLSKAEAFEAGQDVSDALLQKVPIYSTHLKRHVSYYSVLPEDTQLNMNKPDNYASEQASLQWNLSGSVINQLTGTFDYMRDYPHQCWEQKLSRAIVAAIELKAGAKTYSTQLTGQINDAIESMKKFQAENGGMAFWKNSNEFVSPFLSIYTYQYYARLEQPKQHFNPQQIDKLKRYLIGLLDDSQVDIFQKIQVLNALSQYAENSRVIENYYPKLLKSINEKSPQLLSELLSIANNSPKFKADAADYESQLLALSRTTNKKRLFVSEFEMPWYFYDFDAKKYCTAIGSLTKNQTDKKTVYQFVNAAFERRRDLKGDFGNTITNALCAIAISDYVQQYEGANQSTEAQVVLNDERLKLSADQPQRSVNISLDQPLNTQFESSVDGSGYLTTTLTYFYDAMTSPVVANGFALSRQYLKYELNDSNQVSWQNVNSDNLQVGDIVKVRLKVNNPLARRNVALSDVLPGGFFALDEQLTAQTAHAVANDVLQNSWFYEKQLSARYARFYADYLPAGDYTIEYLIKVTHKGKFAALSAKIEEMYDDDVFATSKATQIVVH